MWVNISKSPAAFTINSTAALRPSPLPSPDRLIDSGVHNPLFWPIDWAQQSEISVVAEVTGPSYETSTSKGVSRRPPNHCAVSNGSGSNHRGNASSLQSLHLSTWLALIWLKRMSTWNMTLCQRQRELQNVIIKLAHKSALYCIHWHVRVDHFWRCFPG